MDHSPDDISPITPRLYLSSLPAATSSTTLKSHHITHVLSVLESDPVPSIPVSELPYLKTLRVEVDDGFRTNIRRWFKVTNDWIAKALEESEDSRILVHCLHGQSRSPTILAAYFIFASSSSSPLLPSLYGLSPDLSARQAINFLHSKRSVVRPNIGFVRQLEEYAREEFGRAEMPRSLSWGVGSGGVVRCVVEKLWRRVVSVSGKLGRNLLSAKEV